MSNKKILIKSKLFNLKEWLTIPETASHLSIMFGEEVKEADVLRLALDRHLKLSVNFVNHANAKCGDTFLPFKEWEEKFRKMASWEEAIILARNDGLIAIYFKGFDFVAYLKDDELVKENGPWYFGLDDKFKNKFLNKLTFEEKTRHLSSIVEGAIAYVHKQSEKFEGKVPPSMSSFRGKVFSIEGVWDLPMLGNECLDVEHQYQLLTDGPEITLTGLDGACVEDGEGVIWQLQESMDQNEFVLGSNAQLENLKEHIATNNIEEEKAKELLARHKKQREKYLDKLKKKDPSDNYYPAGGLPSDSVLVVRTQALIDLHKRISHEDNNIIKDLDSRSEKTYLNIIGAMLETFIQHRHGEVDFTSEAKLREFFNRKYAGFKGLTERTLAEKFAAAKKAINEE